jgi:hypothetical protein
MRYFLQVNDLPRARGADDELAFQGATPETFAATLQAALREPLLFQRWQAKQDDPEAIDPTLGETDPAAQVNASGKSSAARTDVEVSTRLPHALLKHRLRLLIGNQWTLSDVRP